jgi:methylenetetrahydrofolate dehydrogenase (NADP+)/methenyltetrahydrofolate cyclohydrolase
MILKGKPLTEEIISHLSSVKTDIKFVVFRVGEDPSSILYVRKKRELFESLKADFEEITFPADISQDKLFEAIKVKNEDPSIGGIIVQMPLPDHINRDTIAAAVATDKDVDGFSFILDRDYKFYPPTILAIDGLLKFYNIDLENKKILIIGGGFLVGSPLAKYWSDQGLDVSILEKNDVEYENKVKNADIAVVATGGGRRFSYSDFKTGSTVIDASTICDGGKIKGDVDLANWQDNINIAPVPGGVGPVTVAMLAKNFFKLS